MRRLTAQYAEYWNAPFIHRPESIAAGETSGGPGLRKAGRDPVTLQRTALMMVDQPGAYRGRLADKMRQFRYRPGVPATGTAEELAALLRALTVKG